MISDAMLYFIIVMHIKNKVNNLCHYKIKTRFRNEKIIKNEKEVDNSGTLRKLLVHLIQNYF